MFDILGYLGALVVGIIVGFFIYRNNAKRIEAQLEEVEKKYNELKTKLGQ